MAPPPGRCRNRGGMTALPTPPAEGRHRSLDWDLALAVLTGAALLRLVFAGLIPLFPDETYYWEWSRHLAAGYFDHPWGIAALIRGGLRLTALAGVAPSPIAVRLLVIVSGFFACWIGAGVARHLGGDRAGLLAAVVFSVMPLAAAGMVLATPDVPLLLGTAAALYGIVRALECPPRSTASMVWWAGAGVALGLAFSSKYTSILLVGATIAFGTRRGLRSRLGEPGPYVACLLATLVFVPVLLWNAQHGWISFTFQLHHGLGAPRGSPLRREIELVGGQAALATPILLAMLGAALWRALRRPQTDIHYLLAVVTLSCVGTFVISAARRPVEANWPALAYIPAVSLLAVTDWSAAGRKWLAWGIGLAVCTSVVIYVQSIVPVLPLPASRDPIARSAGWGQLADSVVSTRRRLNAANATVWAAADKYQDASELAFHLPTQPVTFSLNLSSRANQYDLWPGFPLLARPGDDLIVVLDEVPEPHHTAVVLAPYFRSLQKGSLVALQRSDGEAATYRRLWILRGWDGRWPGTGGGTE
jgi:4-amino-4-deoxy-L-arabinose transferase-like glycosyltransferase